MSLRIVKTGIANSIQDAGRFGYQHLGINPAGVMDTIAMKVANSLVGNKEDEAVIEMHFPATEIMFEISAVFALSGADFTAEITSNRININQPYLINAGSTICFKQPVKGERICLAVKGGFTINKWLQSNSTNSFAKAGGFKGRTLKKPDCIAFNEHTSYRNVLKGAAFISLPFMANVNGLYNKSCIRFLPGRDYCNLSHNAKNSLSDNEFLISSNSNRMGYNLSGISLHMTVVANSISSAVVNGTIQLLPNGQLIVLMADHQTTGGYPVIGHVITADIPSLAQMKAGDRFQFLSVSVAAAEKAMKDQYMHLQQLKNACIFQSAHLGMNE